MNGPATVIGTGSTFWTDWDRLPADRGPIFALNNWVELFPEPIQHGVSHHPDKLVRWRALRSPQRGKARPILLHASAPYEGIDRVWPGLRTGGSSALLAVRIALALGYMPVYIAGVPLDAGGYVWDRPGPESVPGKDFTRYRRTWIESQAELRGKVISPSGFLQELLGLAVAAWAT